MTRLDSFCVAKLSVIADGGICLQLIECGLRQGRATALAAELPIRPGAALLVGSAWVRSLGIHLPRSPGDAASLWERQVGIRLQSWLDWLRASAVIRLGELTAAHREQRVPSRYVVDTCVRNFLGLRCSGIPIPRIDINAMSAYSPQELVAVAPLHSIASLLGTSPTGGDLFSRCLSQLATSDRLQLLVPLFNLTSPVELNASGIRLGMACWRSTGRNHSFELGQMAHITVDREGWVAQQDYPIDGCGIGWAPPGDSVERCLPDPIYRNAGDLVLDRLLDGIPTLVEEVLRGMGSPLCKEGSVDDDQRVLGQTCAKYIESQIAGQCAGLKRLLRNSVFPFDGTAPTVRISQYLYATGDPVRQLRRREAFAAFPLTIAEAWLGNSPRTAAAIDEGRPLLQAISSEHGCPLWAARRAQRYCRRVTATRTPQIFDLAMLLRLVTALGPHTPEPEENALRALVALIQSHASMFELSEAVGWRFTALVRAVGRQAQVQGWPAVREVIWKACEDDGLYAVLDYWDVMRENVAETLLRCGLIVGTDQDTAIAETLLKWLSATSLAQLHTMASRWTAFIWDSARDRRSLAKQDTTSPTLAVEPIFGRFTLIQSRVEVQPLISKEDLVLESSEMRHCVASYFPAVESYRLLIVSLTSCHTRQRATLALRPMSDGAWRVRELFGPANATIAIGSALEVGAVELATHLSKTQCLGNKSVTGRYRERATERATEFLEFQNGRPIFHRFPAARRVAIEPFFPGAGTLESRILRAFSRRTVAA